MLQRPRLGAMIAGRRGGHAGEGRLMEDPRDQLIEMASDAELERRWNAVRAAMRGDAEGRVFAMSVDNYLVGREGVGAERVHTHPRESIVI